MYSPKLVPCANIPEFATTTVGRLDEIAKILMEDERVLKFGYEKKYNPLIGGGARCFAVLSEDDRTESFPKNFVNMQSILQLQKPAFFLGMCDNIEYDLITGDSDWETFER